MSLVATALHFRFEEDFMEDGIRCIPMIVRFKLDRCGIKLKLSEWSKLNELERQHVAELECDSEEDVMVYRSWLQMIVFKKTGVRTTDLASLPEPVWANRYSIPLEVISQLNERKLRLSREQWWGLTDLQRFALMKLSRPGHENRNFPSAVKEFLAEA